MGNERLAFIDAMKGIIMILMAIDHANFFIARVHSSEFWGIPLPDYNSYLSFVTRFVTHICAPGFFLLMGIGMHFFRESRFAYGWSESHIKRNLAFRGLLLIFIQFGIEGPPWIVGSMAAAEGLPIGHEPPGIGEGIIVFGVLYGLGGSMILASLLIKVRTTILVPLGILTIILVQIVTPSSSSVLTDHSLIMRLILIPGKFGMIQVLYPILSWLGIVLFGIWIGRQVQTLRIEQLRKGLLFLGIMLTVAFVAMRFFGFGNFHSVDTSTLIGFLNVNKYPPSLAFIALTIGLIFLIMSFLSKIYVNKTSDALIIFGKAPLFFYILHLYIYAAIGLAFPNGSGWTLMYLFWGIGLVVLFYLCRWYGHFKSSKKINSIWRFF